jgi:hypothetical protein
VDSEIDQRAGSIVFTSIEAISSIVSSKRTSTSIGIALARRRPPPVPPRWAGVSRRVFRAFSAIVLGRRRGDCARSVASEDVSAAAVATAAVGRLASRRTGAGGVDVLGHFEFCHVRVGAEFAGGFAVAMSAVVLVEGQRNDSGRVERPSLDVADVDRIQLPSDTHAHTRNSASDMLPSSDTDAY